MGGGNVIRIRGSADMLLEKFVYNFQNLDHESFGQGPQQEQFPIYEILRLIFQ